MAPLENADLVGRPHPSIHNYVLKHLEDSRAFAASQSEGEGRVGLRAAWASELDSRRAEGAPRQLLDYLCKPSGK
jgi:hypothetical protein